MSKDLERLATDLSFDRVQNIEAVKILPGEYYVTNRYMLIVTVLGSCVAACTRDPATGISGMNHCMLQRLAEPAGEIGLFS